MSTSPHVRQRGAALMRGTTRYVTIIIRMRGDAGLRVAARNCSLRYIFGRTSPCRLYAVVTGGQTPHHMLPGINVDVLAGVPARRDGVPKSLDNPEAKHAEFATGASIRCSPFDTDAP